MFDVLFAIALFRFDIPTRPWGSERFDIIVVDAIAWVQDSFCSSDNRSCPCHSSKGRAAKQRRAILIRDIASIAIIVNHVLDIGGYIRVKSRTQRLVRERLV
jgi:hypothetical protein